MFAREKDMGLAEDIETHKVSPSSMSIYNR
jgi:hypothetical protein